MQLNNNQKINKLFSVKIQIKMQSLKVSLNMQLNNQKHNQDDFCKKCKNKTYIFI